MNKYMELMYEASRENYYDNARLALGYDCPFCIDAREAKDWAVGEGLATNAEWACRFCAHFRKMMKLSSDSPSPCLPAGMFIWNKYVNFFEGSVWDEQIP